MIRLIFILSMFLVAIFSVTAEPVSAQSENKCKKKGGQIAGAVIGGVLGGILGNKIDGGGKRGLGTILGAAGGALVGSALGKKLDKCEQDKVKQATLDAVNDPQSGAERTWVSDTRTDVSGGVVAAPPQKLADGRECRSVTQVSYVSGEEVRESPTLCRVPPQRNWEMARS